MSKLLHLKASRTQILNTFPTSNFGKDGDIVISRILGKGVYLCSKAGGIWYTANKMEELRKTGQISINKIATNQLSINKLVNSKKNNDKFVVSDSNSLAYRTSEQVVDDLDIKVKNIDYKTAYCSLGQYADKNSCEEAGGTWYYSENDSHDSISSTAENQLLTVGQSIGKLDAESTLLYDGSTLEIKKNANYDDNWQTSVQDKLLKLTYDSNNSGYISLNSDGDMNFYVGDDKRFTFFDGDAKNRLRINTETGVLRMNAPDSLLNNCSIDVDSNAATSIATTDFDATAAHLTLVPDGDLVLDPASQKTIINATDGLYFDGGDHTYIAQGAVDRLDFTVGGTLLFQIYEGITDAIHVNCHLDIDAASKLFFDGSASGHTYISESSDDVLDFYVGNVNMLKLTESLTDVVEVVNADFKIPAAKKIAFDGGLVGTYITESSDDILDVYVGGDKMLTIDEANDKIVFGASNWIAGTVSAGTVTEFSAANSSYAGMILGYTCVGNDAADDSYTLTTSFVCFQDSGGTAIKVSFITPPSENVEIEVSLFFSAGSGAQDLILALSDNATFGSSSLFHEDNFMNTVSAPARGNGGTIVHKWLLEAVNLEAIGSSNDIFIAARCDATTGTPIIKWGGTASGEFTNLYLKATALPATIVEGS